MTQVAVAEALTHHGVRVSHLTAVRLVGLDAWAARPRPCVAHDGSALSTINGLHPHRGVLPVGDRATVGGRLAITSPARSVTDIAREFGVEAGVVVADAALRIPLGDRERLRQALDRARGRPCVDLARSAVAFADPRSESVLESRSRWRIHLAGIPAPLTQVDIYDLAGRFRGRVDFLWPEWGVVGEADGRLKYRVEGAVGLEKDREDALRDLGLQVARWGWRDLERFEEVIGRLGRAFARGRTAHGVPQWRASQRPLTGLPSRMVVRAS